MRARQTRGPACRAGRGSWYHLKGLSASKPGGDPQGICRENTPGPGASCAVGLRRSAHEIISALVNRMGQPLELAVEVRENLDSTTARLQKNRGWGGRWDGEVVVVVVMEADWIEELVYLGAWLSNETKFGGASAGASLSGHIYAKAGWWGQALKGGKWGLMCQDTTLSILLAPGPVRLVTAPSLNGTGAPLSAPALALTVTRPMH